MKKLSFREKWGHLSKITQQVRAEQCESPGDEDHMYLSRTKGCRLYPFSVLCFSSSLKLLFLISYFHFYSRIQENTNGQGPSFLLFFFFHLLITQSLNHWTTRQVLSLSFFFFFKLAWLQETLKLLKSSCATQPIKYTESSDEHTAYNMWLCKFPNQKTKNLVEILKMPLSK